MLKDLQIRNLKPTDKPYKKYDTDGLFILIKPSSQKSWRYKYRFGKKEKLIVLGEYPAVTLSEVRKLRDQAKIRLKQGFDPVQHRQAVKREEDNASKNTLEHITREWHLKYSPSWSDGHAKIIMRRLEKDVFPWIGSHPIETIQPAELLDVLRRVEARGAVETAHRIQQTLGQAFRYGVATQRCQRDVAADLRGALPPVKTESFAAITDPVEIGKLLRAIDGIHCTLVVRAALQLAPLVFVRPGELRQAEWSEINLDTGLWAIPAEKMKSKREHLVPLCTQAIKILKDLYPATSRSKYVFPSARGHSRCMSENAVRTALQSLGYDGQTMTGHGFRSMASTLLNEQGVNKHHIEMQLAHVDKNAIRRIYNRAKYLNERRKMMQKWGNYLDSLRNGAEVLPLFQQASI